jgi:hypothetical protein
MVTTIAGGEAEPGHHRVVPASSAMAANDRPRVRCRLEAHPLARVGLASFTNTISSGYSRLACDQTVHEWADRPSRGGQG